VIVLSFLVCDCPVLHMMFRLAFVVFPSLYCVCASYQHKTTTTRQSRDKSQGKTTTSKAGQEVATRQVVKENDRRVGTDQKQRQLQFDDSEEWTDEDHHLHLSTYLLTRFGCRKQLALLGVIGGLSVKRVFSGKCCDSCNQPNHLPER
jgi:hypothetical protein